MYVLELPMMVITLALGMSIALLLDLALVSLQQNSELSRRKDFEASQMY